MTPPNKLLSPCSACASNPGCADTERRQLLGGVAAGGLLSAFPFLSAKAQGGSKRPLQLVDADAEADFKPLRPADLQLGKPLLVFPFDTQTKTLKSESRLNKLVLVRLTEDQMAPDTLARSASGVLAYSGICTHQGCEVKTWVAKEKSWLATAMHPNLIYSIAPKLWVALPPNLWQLLHWLWTESFCPLHPVPPPAGQ